MFDQRSQSILPTPWINPYSITSPQMTPLTSSGAFSPSSLLNYYSSSPRNYLLTSPAYSPNSPTSSQYSLNDPICLYQSKSPDYRFISFDLISISNLYLFDLVQQVHHIIQ
jgi:hypothetical protein